MSTTSLPVVDLRSDTVTRPDAAMRAAIASAEVGDHVLGDDPTADELERYGAELLGKEAALFFPSGIMANQTAILVQTRPGTEVLLEADAHIAVYEEAAASAWAGVQLREIPGQSGVPVPDRYREALWRSTRYSTRCMLVCAENTHNSAGGRLVPLPVLQDLAEACRSEGASLHLDGARLPNAAVASGIEMKSWAEPANTVMISLSKGLGAPAGSLLAGPRDLMEEAWRVRRRFGGAMRQAGLLAAAGIHGLRHNLARLGEDHARASDLATRLEPLAGLTPVRPETNILMIDLDPVLGGSERVVRELELEGVRTVPFGPHRVRAVTHKDVDDEGIERTVAAFTRLTERLGSLTCPP